MELKNDLYLLTYEGHSFVYSPLRRACFFVNDDAAVVIRRYINDSSTENDKATPVWNHIKKLEEISITPPTQRHINNGSHVVIIPTQVCNFGCTYCYAANAHQVKDVMSQETMKIVLDFVLASEEKQKRISFIGGGEPLTAWNLIRWAIDYLEANKLDTDVLNIGITTNASLFTDEMLEYIKKHNIRIGVSFEILPDIQNEQRPFLGGGRNSFEVVINNLERLSKYGIPFNIRSTITKASASRMPEMVEFVAKHYPNLRKLHLEPVTDSTSDYSSFYEEYIKYFYEAKQLGKSYKINVYNSISKSVYQVKKCFCSGELCITPTGSIVACHRVSAEHEEVFPKFNYGKITTSLYFDNEAKANYLKFAQMKKDACEECFAKWHCGGVCPMERAELTDAHISAKCEFIKKTVTRELYSRILQALKTTKK